MTVFKSNRYLYVQVIDDAAGATLASRQHPRGGPQGRQAERRGRRPSSARRSASGSRKRTSTNVVFDRNGYKYHGIVKAIADGARKAGIKF